MASCRYTFFLLPSVVVVYEASFSENVYLFADLFDDWREHLNAICACAFCTTATEAEAAEENREDCQISVWLYLVNARDTRSA